MIPFSLHIDSILLFDILSTNRSKGHFVTALSTFNMNGKFAYFQDRVITSLLKRKNATSCAFL